MHNAQRHRPLLETERKKILYEWNSTHFDYDRQVTLHEMVSTQARRKPDATAVIFENERLTYAELETRSNQLAHHLIACGVQVESFVGLYVERSLDMIVGILGILKAGGAYIPIDPELPAARIAFMMEDAGVRVLLAHEHLLQNVKPEGAAIVCLDRDWPLVSAQPTTSPAVVMDSENLVYAIFTSGSTGRPKAALNVHRSIVNLITSLARRVAIDANDRVLSTTTISFDPSVWEIFLPLTLGAVLIVATRDEMIDGRRLQRVIDQHEVTFLRSTPTGWRLYLESGWQGGSELKILSGGENLTLDLAQHLLQHCAELWHSYGPAEAAVFCTLDLIKPDVQEISIGRPHDNIQIYILDAEQQPVPVGMTGELYIGGDGVGRGYLNRPQLTDERFLPNPFVDSTSDGQQPRMYRSGDLARFRADGRIIFVGREDGQVKIRGRRVELGDIDAAIRRHPAVKQVVTLAREDTPGELRLVAYLTAESGHKLPTAGELRAFLRRSLPEYMLPVRYLLLDKFPVSPNGKLDRKALPAPDRKGEELGSNYIAPRTALEREMAALFAQVLNLERVSIEDSFFDLGGNSLLTARMLYQVQEHFDRRVDMRDFLAGPNVAALCHLIFADQQKSLEADHHLAGQSPSAPEEDAPLARDLDLDLLNQSNLTQGQFLMWMGQQMNPDAPIYNVVHAFAIKGEVDISAFKEAFQALVDHHDSLRTVFAEVNGVPMQQILPKVTAVVEVVDLSATADPDQALEVFLEERQLRLFPFDQPLYDAVLLKTAPEHFIWYFGQHHIVTDAVSSELIFERLGYFYQLALDRRMGDAPDFPQYATFVRSEREQRSTPAFQEALAYWQEKYGTPLPPTVFYGHSDSRSTTHTTRVVQDLGQERSQKLRRIASHGSFVSPSVDLSLFTIFATLLFTTLHRLNGRYTLRLGTPYHGRPTAETMDIIGLFIEMGVIQVDLDDQESFTSLGAKVMNEILDGLPHVQPGISSAATNRAYEVVLNYIQAAYHDFAGLPVSKLPIHSRHIDTNHGLRLQIADYEDTGSFHLYFDMKTALFAEQERRWFVQHFLRVVDAFIADHERSLGSFSLLSEAERKQLLLDFNKTDAPYPSQQTVVQIFEAQTAATPHAVAASEGALSISYAELNRRANQLAHHLQSQGVGRDTAVFICMERSIDVLAAIWAVLKAGGAYVPVDPAYPMERIATMIADAGAAIALVDHDQRLSALADAESLVQINVATADLSPLSAENPLPAAQPDDLVYLIYTSGSTGTPKGTMLTHRGLMNYVWWARRTYQEGECLDFPLYSSLSFDLTVTSIFVPLLSGDRVVIYRDSQEAPGMEILSVFAEDAVDIVKLTPAHLRLVRETALNNKRIRKLIVGGEDFKTDLARSIHELFEGAVEIYNEYGPTEAVVGCMIHRYDPEQDTGISVPIGTPAANARIYLLDAYDQPVPPGISGEMVISSDGVARGYRGRPQLTAERFASDPFRPGARMYRSGDIGRWNEQGQLLFLGRRDHQVKIGSARIELGEIEAVIRTHEKIQDVIVRPVEFKRHLEEDEIFHCTVCGLPSNYPQVTFNEDGICNLCVDFDTFRDDVFQYFKSMEDLEQIVAKAKAERSGDYDCMMLYSGGKDSTYVLSQLVEMDLKILAFSLDNGYISAEALDNVRRITSHLGVDLVIGQTPHMNAIFADSLERFSNVCQGCYKAIYTLSMNLARQKGIKYIFTGLSRGQLFETRLDELFRSRIFDVQQMDQAVLEARKIYHGVDDAVRQLLDVSMFNDDRIFGEIQFIDYFRYTDVELDDLYGFLSTRVPWIRPRDTGRSTNCLINEAGIFVHQTEQGYHNYALPYSWDVRLGHKTREEAMEELDDEMRLPMVQEMLKEVGYQVKSWHAGQSETRLAAYFIAEDEAFTIAELRQYMAGQLPQYMLPAYFVRLQQMPLTVNGKIDHEALPDPTEKRPEMGAAYAPPQSDLQVALAAIWSQTLNVERVGIHDNFFDLGGASIPAVQVVSQINDRFDVPFAVRSFFEHPTVAEQSEMLEDLLLEQLEALSDEEVERLLAEMGE